MLSQSYTAIKQFQRDISDIHSIQKLKSFLEPSKLGLSIKISSPTVWILDWDVSNDTISGTLELQLEPTLSVGDKLLQMHRRSFLFQDPKPSSLVSIEARLIEFLRDSLKNIDLGVWAPC